MSEGNTWSGILCGSPWFPANADGASATVLCRNCGRMFTSRTNSAYQGIQLPASKLDLVLHLSVDGMNQSSIARRREPQLYAGWDASLRRHDSSTNSTSRVSPSASCRRARSARLSIPRKLEVGLRGFRTELETGLLKPCDARPARRAFRTRLDERRKAGGLSPSRAGCASILGGPQWTGVRNRKRSRGWGLDRKNVVVVLLILNAVVLLGQVWPEGAPPFARGVNLVFLSASLLFFAYFLRNPK